jgi:signal peptidase II
VSRLPWLVIALIVAGIDLWTKSAVFDSLSSGETRWIFGQWLGFTEVLNPGITGGMLKGVPPLAISALTGVAATGIAVWILRGKNLPILNCLCLALILGGAIGNLYDRIVYERVRDFIDVWPGLAWPSQRSWLYHWPTFNVADVAIVVGVAGLMVSSLFFSKDGKAAESAKKGD